MDQKLSLILLVFESSDHHILLKRGLEILVVLKVLPSNT